MQPIVKELNEDFARQILQWKYEKPYDFYNNDLSTESMQELLSNSYSAIVDGEDNLVVFLYWGRCLGTERQVVPRL